MSYGKRYHAFNWGWLAVSEVQSTVVTIEAWQLQADLLLEELRVQQLHLQAEEETSRSGLA